MKSIIGFWTKDIINKCIILAALALLVGIVVVVSALLATPQGSVVYDAVFQKSAGIPTVEPVQATATAIFTPTTAFFPSLTALRPAGFSPRATASITKTPSGFASTTTSNSFSAPSSTPLASSAPAPACIPANPRQTGKVLAVLDGNTIKVYTDGLVYVVRYIGIAVPKYYGVQELYGDAATFKNSSLVFGKEVSLVKDVSDKDAAGRLLRYVLVGDKLVNLELARAGLATAVDVPPDSACAQVLKDAEQAARQAQVGRWVATATRPSP